VRIEPICILTILDHYLWTLERALNLRARLTSVLELGGKELYQKQFDYLVSSEVTMSAARLIFPTLGRRNRLIFRWVHLAIDIAALPPSGSSLHPWARVLPRRRQGTGLVLKGLNC
jgi:hypothetical protein